MTSPLLEQVGGIAADVLQVSPSEIGPDSSPQSIASWDSVHHLNLVLALEQEFNLQFEPEEIDGMENIGQIVALIQGKVSAGK
jgi:acyl carrier protein